MLPRIDSPSAPPSSKNVSDIPDAAPARSGGAALTIISVVSDNTGASPSEIRTDAVTSRPRLFDVPTSVSMPSPTAPSTSPPAITYAGRTRRTIRAVRFELMMNPTASGSDHRPAASGDSPSTSCRNWATNRK